MKTLKERIDYIRKKAGLSYNELAKLVGGISGDGLRKAIARGSAKDEYYAKKIAEKTDYSENWVIYGEGEPKLLVDRGESINDSLLLLNKGNEKIHIDEMVDFMENNFDYLMKKSIKYRFFMGDKTNSLMYQFFKDHGIEVTVKTDGQKKLEN